MKCPSCGHIDSKVLESRSIEEHTVVKRRRNCINCNFRFTTYEKIGVVPLIVVKTNGDRELFSHEKILRGLSYACQKRPIRFEQIEELAKETESYMLNTCENYEVSSNRIGEFVIQKLKEMDSIAYIRFASVYRQFTDIDSFVKEITALQNERHED